MFSLISMNWRGRALVSYETIVQLIGSTRSKTGLTIRCELDEATYERRRLIEICRTEVDWLINDRNTEGSCAQHRAAGA